MSKLIIKAKELEDEGNLKVSLTYYEMALSDKSCPYDIRCDMGRVLNKLRNFNEALKCFDIVLTMDEQHIDSLFGKGIASLRLNNWNVALDSFLKAIENDNNNANFYYYVSIILQSNDDEKAKEYYSKFMELDNDEFKQIRSNYDFGLIFLNAESELSNDKRINLKAFEDILKSFNLTDDEIECYLKTLPYDELILKINELNDLAYVENEKRIIRSQFLEMGLDDEDIDDLFLIESVDYLKNDIITRTNNNPFPDRGESINIPLYVENKASELDNEEYIFEELVIEDNSSEDLNLSKEAEKNKLLYKHVRKAIAEQNNFKLAKTYINEIDETKISDETFRINFIYIRGLVLANLNLDLNKVLDDFSSIEQEHPEITNDKNYVHNKNKIETDLKKQLRDD
jgi:Tfp pilus assembly protein PilF